MWADARSNESSQNVLNKTNFSKFGFENGGRLKAPSFEGLDFDQMVGLERFESFAQNLEPGSQNTLNCTESVLLSPLFRSEAERLRDQARSNSYIYIFK